MCPISHVSRLYPTKAPSDLQPLNLCKNSVARTAGRYPSKISRGARRPIGGIGFGGECHCAVEHLLYGCGCFQTPNGWHGAKTRRSGSTFTLYPREPPGIGKMPPCHLFQEVFSRYSIKSPKSLLALPCN
jgi:hypothetical protein